MSDILFLFAAMGVGAFIVLVSFMSNQHVLIEGCKQATGAYECRMVAVPVAQPEWVK